MKQEIKIQCEDLEWLYIPNVLYAEYEDCRRYLQLFIPYRHEWKENVSYPLVIFISGSAWYRQEMYNSIPCYSKLAERGFVTAIVQYRESKIAKYPAQVEDINRAIAFLLSKAGDFHIDTGKIFLAGNSSGGHIALMTAFRRANGITDAKDIPSFEISGVIAESAPVDLFLCAENPEFKTNNFRPSRDLLGVNEMSDNVALAKAAGCEMYIRPEAELPPVLLLHGTEDFQVNVAQSRLLYGQLCAAGKRVDYYELTGCSHGGPAFWTPEILDIIEGFMRR